MSKLYETKINREKTLKKVLIINLKTHVYRTQNG